MRSHTPASFRTPQKLLLVASTGGHLSELVRLEPGLNASADSLWVTFRTPQSESLLAGRRVLYVPYVRPRDIRGIVRAATMVMRLLATESFDLAVSTGSALALAALPIARLKGIRTLYIESVCRVTGPSMTGRILAKLRFTEMRSQHARWSGGAWGTHTSILHTYHPVERFETATPERIFVTVGTIEGYRFDSVVDAVLMSGLANENTVWQLGYTTGRDDLPGTVHQHMPTDDFLRSIREADVVVTHAGVGTLLTVLNEGVYPVLATRRASRSEHVDDHQTEIADLVNQLGIGIAVETSELSERVLIEATGRGISDRAPVGDPVHS